uniref:Uncharacterized protein n=1 Tax=Tanacetum cinerariifolium TaxID=118510 RepID=A0A6L2LMT3_TANCI|nr:hypothetical protein [Tanacetum cinerariifolium]
MIPDSEETLMLVEESHSKMILKQQDPMVLENKSYNSMNSLDFNLSKRSTKVEVPEELPKVSMEFACILHIPCHGACVFTPEGAITSLPNGINSNPDIYPPPLEDPLLIRDALFDHRPPGKTRKHFNLAYYFVNRMVIVTRNVDMTLSYEMLLTQLVEHICVSHPHAFSDDIYLVDHVMIPFSERRVFRIMPGGKRPRLLTPTHTPFGSSESTYFSYQGEENDLINNFTLDPIPYINQLPPIEGGES